MKKQTALATLSILTIALFCTLDTGAQNTAKPAPPSVAGCAAGSWSPGFVSRLESGDASSPKFHTIWAYACGGHLSMVRLGNTINGGSIDISVLKDTHLPSPCASGSWTPGPLARAQAGNAASPQFHTVWGFACGGQIYMLRLGNTINGSTIDISVLKQLAAPCATGRWSPEPVSRFDNDSPTSPQFHTIWGYSCSKKLYMLRFGNTINGSTIDASILGSTPIN